MSLLNEPTPDPDAPRDSAWSESIGLRRGIVRAAWVTCLLCCLMACVAWLAPTVALNAMIRAFLALVLTCILFAAIQDAAGMAGSPITALAITACAVVMLSQHIVFACFGVQLRSGIVSGWSWFNPLILIAANLTTPIGIAFGWWLCRDGASPWSALLDIFNRRVR